MVWFMEKDNWELGEGKHVPNNVNSSDDEWDSDEDEDITSIAAGYTQLPQDPVENGEELNYDGIHSESEEVLSSQRSHS